MVVLDFHIFERGVTLDVNKQSLPLVLVTVQSKTMLKDQREFDYKQCKYLLK